MVVVVKKFNFFVLQFNEAVPRSALGVPKFKEKFPLKPTSSCFFKIILSIPAVPSASYLADGEVTTSTLSIDSAGSCLNPCGPDIPTSPDGLPLIRILTLSFPLKETAPSTSTETDGTLPSTSATDPPLTVISFPTL